MFSFLCCVFGGVRVVHMFSFLCCVVGGVRVVHMFSFLCCVFGGIRVIHMFSFLCCVFGGIRVVHMFSFQYVRDCNNEPQRYNRNIVESGALSTLSLNKICNNDNLIRINVI
jgi:hypothetical protein